MKTPLALAALLAAPCLLAGPFNVANLSMGDICKFTVASDGVTQDFILSFGQTSGTFFLPEKKASLSVDSQGKPSVDIPAAAHPRLAILHKVDDKLEFRIIESKPSPDKWTFRILNLGSEAITIGHGKDSHEIPAGAETSPAIKGRNDIRFTTPDGTAHAIPAKETEPTSVLAVLIRSEEGWHVSFVMDR
ncbi:hypothetical protein HZ994_11865 [Akkermansiaceae bacterium]|nr:hypothetical protein HZ994_11865 [Akkermansiaceae bacterium]